MKEKKIKWKEKLKNHKAATDYKVVKSVFNKKKKDD